MLDSARGPLHVSVQDIEQEGTKIGKLVLVHDMSFIQRRSEETKKYVFYFFVGLGAIVSLITVVIAQLKLLACRNRHGLLAEHIDPRTREQWGNFVQTYSMVGLSIRWDQAF